MEKDNKNPMRIYTPDRSESKRAPAREMKNLTKLMRNSVIGGFLLGALVLGANKYQPKTPNPLGITDSTGWYSTSPNTLWDAYMKENIKHTQSAWRAYQNSVNELGPFPDLDNDGYIAGKKISK